MCGWSLSSRWYFCTLLAEPQICLGSSRRLLFSLLLDMELTFLGFAKHWAWVEECKKLIEAHFWRGAWKELCYSVHSFNYNLGDLRSWPFDGCEIYAEDRAIYFLGSLKAACRLEQFSTGFGKEINYVVSMCLDDMTSVRGAPHDWQLYFASCSAACWAFSLQDICVEASAEAEKFYQQAKHTADAWIEAATRLWACREKARAAGSPFHVLFHCVGGINRSTGMLCAWLIIGHGSSAEGALRLVLEARPSLRPWRRRDYVLWCLRTLEYQQDKVRPAIQCSANVMLH